MNKINKMLVFGIVLIIIFAVFIACEIDDNSEDAPAVVVAAPASDPEINWEIALENLLIQFPTILDETVFWETANALRETADLEQIGVTPDGTAIYMQTTSMIYLPARFRFQDLDGDGIPEVIISYTIPESGFIYDKIYKLYDDSYVQINQDNQHLFNFYTSAEGKLVASIKGQFTINAVYFVEIINGELILTDYIDSTGSDNFNGVKYDNIVELLQTMDVWGARDLDKTLQPIPEIDLPDIVSAVQFKVYSSD